jgi:hypothetical protein
VLALLLEDIPEETFQNCELRCCPTGDRSVKRENRTATITKPIVKNQSKCGETTQRKELTHLAFELPTTKRLMSRTNCHMLPVDFHNLTAARAEQWNDRHSRRLQLLFW